MLSISLKKKYLRSFNVFCFTFFIYFISIAQTDSLSRHLKFSTDFRFRIEQDWNSKKSDGSLRKDRTRLRYRFRFGAEYQKKWYTAGFRIRTGDPKKQQDPQLTLGDAFSEFGTLPIGFEKIYFQGQKNDWTFWLGKNTFPFYKTNELFWSDNVFTEGVFLKKSLNVNSNLLNHLQVNAGHFILRTQGTSFDEDAFFQGAQIDLMLFNKRVRMYPAWYRLINIPNIPDGGGTYTINYSIIHCGLTYEIIPDKNFKWTFDYYYNMEDYGNNIDIELLYQDQKAGYVTGLSYGDLKKAGHFRYSVTYAYLQQFSILDYMSQNDWARWDYSAYNSPDGRLTNYQGVELVVSYAVDAQTNLVMKCYRVKQLESAAAFQETGDRIRFDLNFKF